MSLKFQAHRVEQKNIIEFVSSERFLKCENGKEIGSFVRLGRDLYL
jgi:hypothetical protein